ncbi:MAG: transcriptional regulator EpsA [Nitrosomonadales bacterium]|nr:transcriptional regulator EpsA [Nitrosomonadales bacterium]
MSIHTGLSDIQKSQFFGIVNESLSVKSNFEFMLWSQGNLQQFLPHEIMISAWGDFSLGLIDFEIISPIPDVHSAQNTKLVPLLKRLFDHWSNHASSAFTVRMKHGLSEKDQFGYEQLSGSFREMRSAIVHAVKDKRGRHDCLYLLLSRSETPPASARKMLETLLPNIDCTLRQIGRSTIPKPEVPLDLADDGHDNLSTREQEIMEWVCKGKTNFEIGMILDISAFTVKNHLQRIFKKLDVMNRAQAVAKLSSLVVSNESV